MAHSAVGTDSGLPNLRAEGVRCGTVEPHRGNYPEEAEPRRHRGERQYAPAEGQAWFEPHVDEAGHRAPERRGGARMPPGTAPGMVGPIAAVEW
jgi:hypothetical protein